MTIPASTEYPPFFAGYIGLVPETDIVSVLAGQTDLVQRLAARVGADRELHRYAFGKWTIRQVMGHLLDAERIFAFRALCFSRAEQQPLPGFSENEYVERSRFNDRPLADMAEEFALVRRANVKMLSALDEEQWGTAGISNGKSITVRALAYVMAGHVRHHMNILGERYGVELNG